jgi:hypothetical protein
MALTEKEKKHIEERRRTGRNYGKRLNMEIKLHQNQRRE